MFKIDQNIKLSSAHSMDLFNYFNELTKVLYFSCTI